MPTTVVKSIGTSSRDYSTLQAWEDACPANLVTADQIWRGECYNDSEFSAGLSVAGMTTDATRYIELTVAAGQSFQDHASVRSNVLHYNQSYGAAVTTNSNYSGPFSIAGCRISRLQLRNTGNGGMGTGSHLSKDLIVNSSNTGVTFNGGSVVINVLGICGASPFMCGSAYGGVTVTYIGCTAVRGSLTPSDTGFANAGGTSALQSCAVFGFTAPASGTGWSSGNCFNNATDAASGLPGSSNQHSVTYSSSTPFENGIADYRAVAGSTLAGNGYRDATNAPNDISGYTRPASPTIGVWQLATAPVSPRGHTFTLMGVM